MDGRTSRGSLSTSTPRGRLICHVMKRNNEMTSHEIAREEAREAFRSKFDEIEKCIRDVARAVKAEESKKGDRITFKRTVATECDKLIEHLKGSLTR